MSRGGTTGAAPAPLHLRIHDFVAASLANGPGRWAVVWVQGCSLGCPGCFNPQTHPAAGGQMVSLVALLERICGLAPDLQGLTVSGGEPLQQAPALLRGLRACTQLSVLLFTGYTWAEVQAMGLAPALAECVDVLIAGRYRAGRPADLAAIPGCEVAIDPEGNVTVSGIAPPAGGQYHEEV